MSRSRRMVASVTTSLLDVCRWFLLQLYRLVALFDRGDIFIGGGLAAIGYGLGQFNVPLAWCVCGAALFWLGVRH